MSVSSGPGKERLVRNGILAGMFLFMGLWFAYDGWRGYANQNLNDFLEVEFDADVRKKAAQAEIYPTVTDDCLVELENGLSRKNEAEQLAYLESFFGGPPSFKHENSVYYFGKSLFLEFESARNRLTPLEPKYGNQTETSIQWQKVFGVVITALGLGIVAFVIYAARSRAEVTDAGLSIRNRQPIPFENMKALRHDHFIKKGLIDIDYERDGAQKTVRLDEYHYNKAKFGEIVAYICGKTGFHDPVQAEKDAKRAAAATASS